MRKRFLRQLDRKRVREWDCLVKWDTVNWHFNRYLMFNAIRVDDMASMIKETRFQSE